MVVFTKEFGTLDPHLPIVLDKVPKKTFFFDTFPNNNIILRHIKAVSKDDLENCLIKNSPKADGSSKLHAASGHGFWTSSDNSDHCVQVGGKIFIPLILNITPI